MSHKLGIQATTERPAGIPLTQNGLVDAVDRWLEQFWSLTPGIRRGGLRIAICTIAYIPLMLLFIVSPLLGAIAGLVVGIVFGGWKARETMAAWLPPLRSSNHLIRTASWVGLVILLVAGGLPLALAVSVVAAPASLAVLVWWIVWRERGSLPNRILQAAVATIVTPVALGVWYLRRGNGWSKLFVVATIMLWLDTYGTLAVSSWLVPDIYGSGTLGPFLVYAVALVTIVGLFLVSAAVRLADRFSGPAAEAGRLSGMALTHATHRGFRTFVDIGLSLFLRLGLWVLIQSAFLIPWIFVVQQRYGEVYVLIYFFVGLAVLPMAVTSLTAMFQGWGRSQRTAEEWMQQHLGAAVGWSLLLGLGVSVTFVALTSSALLNLPTGVPYTAVMACVAGLNIGLSLRTGRRMTFRKYSTYLTTGVTVGLAMLASLALMGSEVHVSTLKSPSTWSDFGIDISRTATYPASVVIGLCSGLLISAVLHPGLRSFASAIGSLREMVKPLVGFVCGYGLIVLTFGAAYYAIEVTVGGFDCTTADSHTITIVRCNQMNPSSQPVESDFMFFSVNTALPLGYSKIKPADDAHSVQWLAATELIVGTAWVVIVFAAMLHTIQAEMISGVTVSALTRMQRTGIDHVWAKVVPAPGSDTAKGTYARDLCEVIKT